MSQIELVFRQTFYSKQELLFLTLESRCSRNYFLFSANIIAKMILLFLGTLKSYLNIYLRKEEQIGFVIAYVRRAMTYNTGFNKVT